MCWKLEIIKVEGYEVRVWINNDDSQAVAFFKFGRYAKYSSDVSALDLATDSLVSKNRSNVIDFKAYKSSKEETAIISIAA